MSAGEKIAESPSPPRRRVRRESSIPPSASVRYRRGREHGLPSFAPSLPPREFLFIIVVIVIEGRSKETPAHCHCYRSARSTRSLGCLLCQRACKWDRRRTDGGRTGGGRRKTWRRMMMSQSVPLVGWVGWEPTNSYFHQRTFERYCRLVHIKNHS